MIAWKASAILLKQEYDRKLSKKDIEANTNKAYVKLFA